MLESDVTSGEIIEGSDYNTGESQKKIVLRGKKTEIINLKKKPSLFGKNFKLNDCGSLGCTLADLNSDQKKKLDNCNYRGVLESDEESSVNVAMCSDIGHKDIFVVSSKVIF